MPEITILLFLNVDLYIVLLVWLLWHCRLYKWECAGSPGFLSLWWFSFYVSFLFSFLLVLEHQIQKLPRLHIRFNHYHGTTVGDKGVKWECTENVGFSDHFSRNTGCQGNEPVALLLQHNTYLAGVPRQDKGSFPSLSFYLCPGLWTIWTVSHDDFAEDRRKFSSAHSISRPLSLIFSLPEPCNLTFLTPFASVSLSRPQIQSRPPLFSGFYTLS